MAATANNGAGVVMASTCVGRSDGTLDVNAHLPKRFINEHTLLKTERRYRFHVYPTADSVFADVAEFPRDPLGNTCRQHPETVNTRDLWQVATDISAQSSRHIGTCLV